MEELSKPGRWSVCQMVRNRSPKAAELRDDNLALPPNGSQRPP
jgi:hypothetical protein